MSKWERPQPEVIQQLRNHRRALASSAKSYDEGEKWEAARLATATNTLVYDGRSGASILTQLDLLGRLEFLSSAPPRPAGNLIMWQPLVGMQPANGEHAFVPQLDRASTRPLPFETWWDEVIFVSQQLPVTRSQLVRTLRDKEGGGHLDDQLNRDGYLSMSREAWTSHMADGSTKPMLGLEAANMRQVAWELIKTLETLPDEMRGE
jgi:hypothetical protein